MPAFSLTSTLRDAERRLERASPRRRRADAGRSRLHPAILEAIRELVLGQERPPMVAIERHVAALCARRRLSPPARASLYNVLRHIPGHTYEVQHLPAHVREALYNLSPTSQVPGQQLAFYCINYGPLSAVSFAAALPWLDLYQALGLRGWRARSRGLLEAVMRARGIQ